MGIYGYSINHNRANMVMENKGEYDDLFSEAIIMTESIVYNEFLNHKYLLESFTGSNEERKVMEEKCDLLLEISMKDIKQKIIELFEKLKTFIKTVISKIKNIFTKEKEKRMEKEISELKKKINNLESVNTKLKDESKNKDKEIDSLKQQNEKQSKDTKEWRKVSKDLVNDYNKAEEKHEKEISSMNSKLEEEIAKSSKMYKNIIKLIDNPLLRFSMYDYAEKNMDLVRFINTSTFDNIMWKGDIDKSEKDANDYKLSNRNLEQLKTGTSVIKKEIIKKIMDDSGYVYNDGKGDYFRDGGYDHSAINRFLESELERISKEKNPLSNKSINECLKTLEWTFWAGSKNVKNCCELIAKYEQAITMLQKNIKAKRFEDEKITHKYAESGVEFKGNIEFANFIVAHIKDQTRCLSLLASYEGKKSGLALAIVELWNRTFGTGNRYV